MESFNCNNCSGCNEKSEYDEDEQPCCERCFGGCKCRLFNDFDLVTYVDVQGTNIWKVTDAYVKKLHEKLDGCKEYEEVVKQLKCYLKHQLYVFAEYIYELEADHELADTNEDMYDRINYEPDAAKVWLVTSVKNITDQCAQNIAEAVSVDAILNVFVVACKQ